MLYAVPRWRPAARATSLAFNGRSEPCKARSTFAAATTAPTGFPGEARPKSLAVPRRWPIADSADAKDHPKDGLGLGLLAARDVVSFLRHGSAAGNPCAGDIRHAYAFGASQSGRFLRQLLYLGLNEDEAERLVFDGMLVHIAGGKRGGDFNMRFGQPSASLPSDPFPFNETAGT